MHRMACSLVSVLVTALAGSAVAGPSQEAAELAGAPLVLAVEAGASPRPALVRLSVAAVHEAAPPPQVLEIALGDRPVEVPLELDRTLVWRVNAEAEGLWAPVLTIAPDAAGPFPLTLWPASELSLSLRPAVLAGTLERVRFRLGEVAGPPLAGAGRQPRGSQEVVCPVRMGRLAGCRVPAGRWNLRIDADGFAPHLLWDRTLGAGEASALGTFELRRGALIAGQVLTADGAADPAHASVELHPLLEPDPLASAEEEAELEQLAVMVPIDPRGRFQLEGVPAGAYRIIARQPGLAPAATDSPVVVEQGGLHELEEPLILERLLRLSVFVEPSVGLARRPWHLRLLRARGTELLQEVAASEIDPSGRWESQPLPPGPYVVRILDEDENNLRWQEVDLRPGAEEVLVDLSLVFVEGELLLGDQPLAGTLWFGGRAGGERVKAESDSEGEFLVVLPRDGEWVVDVVAHDPQVSALGVELEVERLADLDTAEVRIRLPDTRLSGEVVDELGFPVVSPAVRAMAMARRQGAHLTDGDFGGRFEVRGLSEDAYMVEAQTPEGRSEPMAVTVTEGVDAPIRLVVRSQKPMAGRVVSAAGPVAHALVQAYPVTSSGQIAAMRVPRARTDLEGVFWLEVPGGTANLLLVVLAPGYSLGVRRVVPGEPLEIGLPSEQGTLRLEGTAESSSQGAVDLVMVQGAPIDLPILRTWAQMNGHRAWQPGRVSIPAMPSGDYAHCQLTLQEALLVLGGLALPRADACVEGYLPPGGELVLGSGS